jgi:hypothetical protein
MNDLRKLTAAEVATIMPSRQTHANRLGNAIAGLGPNDTTHTIATALVQRYGAARAARLADMIARDVAVQSKHEPQQPAIWPLFAVVVLAGAIFGAATVIFPGVM